MKRFVCLIAAVLLIAGAGCQLVSVPMSATYTLSRGIAVGGSAQPYLVYSDIGLNKVNNQLKENNAPVTLADTYAAAYNYNFEKALPDGETGKIAGNMEEATRYFQKILAAEGVKNPENYLLTIIETAQTSGFTLLAAVYRPLDTITVKKKLDPTIKETLQPGQTDYYMPYRNTADGRRLDTVYDWAAVPNDCFAAQSQQAILMTLSANKVIEEQASPDYWAAEEKWLAGNYMAVVTSQDENVCGAMGTEEGSMIETRREKR